jgi:predicted nucleic acid-binding protein
VLDAVLAAQVRLLYDDRILAEYRTVLRRGRFGFDPRHVAAVLAFLRAEGEPVSAPPLGLVLPDPYDAPFIEVAVAGRADALVTGNTAHFPVCQGIPVLTPAEFLQQFVHHA